MQEKIQEQDRCRAKGANRQQIERALGRANAGLGQLTGGPWRLSTRSRYQLSNRFAWSWKLASLGVPVVLVYVGLLHAEEMRADGEPLHSYDDWKNRMLRYCRGTVDEACWDRKVIVHGIPFRPMIRVVEQSLGL